MTARATHLAPPPAPDSLPAMLLDLPYLVQDRDRHGNVRVYFRHAGRKVRLRDEPGSPAFLAAYHDLKSAVDAGRPIVPEQPRDARLARPLPGTLRALCVAYFASRPFLGLDPRTQRVRRSILEATMREPERDGSPRIIADLPLRALTARVVKVLRDRKAHVPEAANGRVKAMRQVIAWGIEEGWPGLAANVARDVAYIRTGSAGFHSWTEAEVEQYEAHWPAGTRERRALTLLLLTGARRSDVVRLGPGNLSQRRHVAADGVETTETWLRWRQHKGRGKRNTPEVDMPVLPELAAELALAPAGRGTFIETDFGRPFTAAGFGNWFSDRCRAAGLVACSAHGLRKAGAARAAENGATEQQLMSMFGWLTPKEAARYTAAARRKVLARAGIATLSRPASVSHPGGGQVSHQSQTVENADNQKAVVPRAGTCEPIDIKRLSGGGT